MERRRAGTAPRRRPPRERHHPGRRPGKLIWGDARLHEELAYCVPLGIPHSAFLSWDATDQDKALAWRREQSKVCRGCGTRREEWDRDRFAYVGDIEHCPGCELLEQEKEHLKDDEEKGLKGLSATLIPRAVAEARAAEKAKAKAKAAKEQR